jgi:hypothetical protein
LGHGYPQYNSSWLHASEWLNAQGQRCDACTAMTCVTFFV